MPFELYWSQTGGVLRAALLGPPGYEGWVALGFPENANSGMVGADAVISWASETQDFVGDYYLGGYTTAQVQITNRQKLIATGSGIANGNSVATIFARSLYVSGDPPPVQISPVRVTPIIYAMGPMPASFTASTPLQKHVVSLACTLNLPTYQIS